MVDRSIRVRPAQHHDLVPIAQLMQRQAMRLQSKHTVLHLIPGLEERLLQQLSQSPLVAINEHEVLRGYVLPAVWPLTEQSILHAFLTSRNGIASSLALPNPGDEDSHAVAEALLQALGTYWRSQDTCADLIRWPSHDNWLRPILQAQGFLIDSICAFRPTMPLEHTLAEGAGWIIREVTSTDEEEVVALFREELAYHEELGLFARVSPNALEAFRTKLAACWSGESQHDQATIVLVAETSTGIVAMAQCTRIEVTADDEPGFTQLGSYGCLDNVCVSASARGQGIGRALTQQALLNMQQWQPDGYLLWYSADNPLSSRFWPKRGFTPLWTTYQRLHGEVRYEGR
jgi:GNAT superfamily N-acetyltransferase